VTSLNIEIEVEIKI